MNHSPLPFSMGNSQEIKNPSVQWCINGADGNLAFTIKESCDIDNSGLIIRAANSHYALCDLLNQCVQGLKAYEHKGDYPLDVLILQCEELIEKLKKEDK